MGSTDARAFEVVLLAAAFRNPRGRAYIVEFFPQSVVDLYDIVVAHPDWHETDSLTAKALLVARILDVETDVAARYQADVDAGVLGFGAGEDPEMDAAIDRGRQAAGAHRDGAPAPSRPSHGRAQNHLRTG